MTKPSAGDRGTGGWSIRGSIKGRRRLHVNNLSNITLSNEEPLSHETPQQQENRLQISKRNQ